jgi:glycosyltransferase involved in cell wall biosynthesis
MPQIYLIQSIGASITKAFSIFVKKNAALMPQTIVIYDRYHQGHHTEYLLHLAGYLEAESIVNKQFVLVVTESVASKLQVFTSKHFIVKQLTPEAIEALEQEKNTFARGKKEIEWIEHVVGQSFDHLHFMRADEHALLLGSAFMKAKSYTLSGILFAPYWRQKLALQGLQGLQKWILQLKVWRKKAQAKYMLANKNITNLFLCNDDESAIQLNHIHQTKVYAYLPDPMANYQAQERSEELYHTFGLDSAKKTITLFGALSPRKNVENSLLSYTQLPQDIINKTQFLLAGKPESTDYAQQLEQFLKKIQAQNPALNIVYRPDYFSESQMKQLFAATNVFLACYSNFFYSSGILGHAAVHHAKTLVPHYSLMAQLSEQFLLGASANPLSVESMAQALQKLLSQPNEPTKAQEYLQSRSPKDFAETILSQVGN